MTDWNDVERTSAAPSWLPFGKKENRNVKTNEKWNIQRKCCENKHKTNTQAYNFLYWYGTIWLCLQQGSTTIKIQVLTPKQS